MELVRWIASAEAFAVALLAVILLGVVATAVLSRGILEAQKGGDLKPYMNEVVRFNPLFRVLLVAALITGVANVARCGGVL